MLQVQLVTKQLTSCDPHFVILLFRMAPIVNCSPSISSCPIHLGYLFYLQFFLLIFLLLRFCTPPRPTPFDQQLPHPTRPDQHPPEHHIHLDHHQLLVRVVHEPHVAPRPSPPAAPQPLLHQLPPFHEVHLSCSFRLLSSICHIFLNKHHNIE